MEEHNKLQSRKPNRDQYRAERKAKYEKKQEDDLYELLKRERLQQSHRAASGNMRKSDGTNGGRGTRKGNTIQISGSAMPSAGNPPIPNQRMQEAQAAYQTAAKTGKKINAKRNADYYISDNEAAEEALATEKKKSAHRNVTPPSGMAIFAILVLFVLAIGAVTAFSVAAKHNEENKSTSGKATPTVAPTEAVSALQADREITAVLEQVNTENMTLQLWSIEDADVLLLSYSSVTDIRNKYDESLVAGQLETGDIVKVSYDTKQKKAITVEASAEAWELVRQSGLSVNPNRALVALRSQNYAYTDALHVYDQGKKRQLKDIAEDDVVTLRGIGNEVYVIQVDRGHGYLTLSAAEDYIGGSLYVDNDFQTQITEKMVVQISEGTYEITVENQDLTATIEAKIMRNETTVLDLTNYARVPDPMCQVTFQISPSGAILYLNGENTYYKNTLELAYGIYEIKVESGGYVTYEGTLNVTGATMTRSISLSEETIEEDIKTDIPDTEKEEDNEGAEDKETAGEEKDNAALENGGENDEEEKEVAADNEGAIDTLHSIFVYSDNDVEVYLNGEYVGVTVNGVVEFEKVIGSVTLELVRESETKSYTIQVRDDGEDVKFHCYFD